MANIKTIVRMIVPKGVILTYHKMLSYMAAMYYRHPSREMLVVGVTGTNGKTTTATMIARVLEGTHYKVGLATTAEFQIGSITYLNDKKMTMLGRFQLQKLLREMADAGCKYAVIEVSSEGVVQHRIDGIDFDIAVFTNLTPEHIESHGSFENYKKAKGKFFAHLSKTVKKYATFEGDTEVVHVDESYETRNVAEKIAKTIVVNGDDKNSDYFFNFDAEEKYCYGIQECCNCCTTAHRTIRATDVTLHDDHSTFNVGGLYFSIGMPGIYNVYNALAAITVGLTRGMGFSEIATQLNKITGVPGRFEHIDEGQNFKVIIDYAPEVASMEALYKVIDAMQKRRVIHVLGSCGGGRDKDRRPKLGKIAANHSDIVIVTNEDPYDDDPMEIINDVAQGAKNAGKIQDKNLFLIEDRRAAIHFALQQAGENDVVLITGKGSEQAMCIKNGEKVPWDDRMVTREELQALHL